jgi:hypothetical protein
MMMQNITAVGISGRSYSPYSRQEAENEEETKYQEELSKA